MPTSEHSWSSIRLVSTAHLPARVLELSSTSRHPTCCTRLIEIDGHYRDSITAIASWSWLRSPDGQNSRLEPPRLLGRTKGEPGILSRDFPSMAETGVGTPEVDIVTVTLSATPFAPPSNQDGGVERGEATCSSKICIGPCPRSFPSAFRSLISSARGDSYGCQQQNTITEPGITPLQNGSLCPYSSEGGSTPAVQNPRTLKSRETGRDQLRLFLPCDRGETPGLSNPRGGRITLGHPSRDVRSGDSGCTVTVRPSQGAVLDGRVTQPSISAPRSHTRGRLQTPSPPSRS